MDRIDQIMEYGLQAQGKNELLKYLKGGKLTLRQAVKAKCYECESYYQDGKQACEITTCPLQAWNVYREGGVQKSKTLSDAGKKRFAERVRNSGLGAGA